MTQLNRLSVAVVTSLLLAACGGDAAPTASGGTEITVSTATLDSLPRISITEGGVVCVGIGAGTPECPLQTAIANWLSKDEFAMWEPGRRVSVWRVGDTVGVPIGDLGRAAGQYTDPGAVAGGPGGEVLVIDAGNNSLLRFDSHGVFVGSKQLPLLSGMLAWGFAGDLPLLQRIIARDSISGAELQLRVLASAGDSTGREALRVPMPWLHLRGERGDEVASALPLFPIQPVYAIGEGGALAWSSADRLWIRRLSASGATEWTLTSNIIGPPVDSAEIAARSKLMLDGGVAKVDLDSMVARTPANHAAVTGMLMGRDGRLILARASVPGSDSLDFLVISKDGHPEGRFTLSKRAHPLLFRGDSLLIQRPTEGEPLEVRWMLLPKTK